MLVDVHVALLFGELLAALPRLGCELPWRFGRTLGVGTACVLLATTTVDLGTTNNRQLFDVFNTPDVAPPRTGPFRQTLGNPALVYQAPLRNEGHLRCYEPNPIRISRALEAEPANEVRLLEGSGVARLESWSPNAVDIAIEAPRERAAGSRPPADTDLVVVVNTNHHEDWRVEPGEVVDIGGRLGARLPGGTTRARLEFRPAGILSWALVSLSGLLACGLVWAGTDARFGRGFLRFFATSRHGR